MWNGRSSHRPRAAEPRRHPTSHGPAPSARAPRVARLARVTDPWTLANEKARRANVTLAPLATVEDADLLNEVIEVADRVSEVTAFKRGDVLRDERSPCKTSKPVTFGCAAIEDGSKSRWRRWPQDDLSALASGARLVMQAPSSHC